MGFFMPASRNSRIPVSNHLLNDKIEEPGMYPPPVTGREAGPGNFPALYQWILQCPAQHAHDPLHLFVCIQSVYLTNLP